jgi:hypothetical protein
MKGVYMNTTQELFPIKASVLMVRAAVAMIVFSGASGVKAAESAADETVSALTQPTSILELGVLSVSDGSYKFGEYNGLPKKGGYAIGNIDIEKRSPYDSTGTNYWRLQGKNLGFDNRGASFEYGEQGWFRFNLGYDELERNLSDSYQTPFLGPHEFINIALELAQTGSAAG